MSAGLATATGAIEVGDVVLAKDAEGRQPLGGDVDTSLRRGTRDEEDLLPLDEGPVNRLDHCELLAHDDSSFRAEADGKDYHLSCTSLMVQFILV